MKLLTVHFELLHRIGQPGFEGFRYPGVKTLLALCSEHQARPTLAQPLEEDPRVRVGPVQEGDARLDRNGAKVAGTVG